MRYAAGEVTNHRGRAMPDIRLILTDIDGTILPYGQTRVGERCLDAFHAAMDAGLRVGPASGRGLRWIPPLLRDDGSCCATALASNGMEVYLDGCEVHKELLPHDALRSLADVLRGMPGCGLVCFDDVTPELVVGSREELTRCFPSYGRSCVSVDDVPRIDIVKANVFSDDTVTLMHELADRLAALIPQLDFDVPRAGWLNVLTRGWGKGPAIDVLCGRLGIGLDQVAVFGDGGNDVSMLSYVPLSFAVSGATRDAKDAARYLIGACEDDAVPMAIEALVRGEVPPHTASSCHLH